MKERLLRSLVLPFFTFNCCVYPCLDFECNQKMNVAFNDCLRFIYNIPRYTSVARFKTTLFGMSLDNFYKMRNLLQLHKIIYKECPQYLNEMLHFAQSRRGLRLILPQFTHLVAERSFFVSAIRLWNTLPVELQRTHSSAIFQRKIFLHLST